MKNPRHNILAGPGAFPSPLGRQCREALSEMARQIKLFQAPCGNRAIAGKALSKPKVVADTASRQKGEIEMNKIAMITGAGSGVGRAVARALAAVGWSCTLVGRKRAALDETAAMLGGEHLVTPADIGEPEAVKEVFAQIAKTFGRLDMLFNNAGMGTPAVPIEDLTFAQWQAIVGVNLTGAFLCTQEAVRMMKAQTPRGGRIINNGSISADRPRPHSAPYTATKHAITGLTKSIILDGRPFDIAGGQIDIGNAATEMTERMTQGVLQPDGKLAVEPRMDVDHVAQAVAYMAGLPLESNVPFMTVMATKMPLFGRG
jgi:NAD(P)-dependent dehydrogenase (short-subunit alcohol dehydrogenase family)